MDKSSLQAIGQDQPALQLFQACCYLESTGAQQSAAAGWHSHRTHTPVLTRICFHRRPVVTGGPSNGSTAQACLPVTQASVGDTRLSNF